MTETDRIERWDCMSVCCVKPFEGLRAGSTYRVNGRGNLEYNNGTEKTGWGLSVEDEFVGVFDENGKVIKGSERLSWKERTRWVYLTLEELEEHFITDEENYRIYMRDEKIKALGI